MSKNCNERHGNVLSPPDLSKLSIERLGKYEKVKSAIEHAWSGYNVGVLKKHSYMKTFLGILPPDDLAPLSSMSSSPDKSENKNGITWLHSAATLYDSLDTLYIAGLMEEYEEAKLLVLSLPLPIWPTKTFEYSIRVLGGLLGGFAVSGDVELLANAKGVANAMIDGPFRSSPTSLPRKYDVLAPTFSNNMIHWGGILVHRTYALIYRRIRDKMKEHTTNSLAGVGSFTLEFTYLSHLLNNPTYKQHSDAIFQHVNSKTGVVPMLWNVMNGHATGDYHSLGSGSDSYYEYLGKLPILLQLHKKQAIDINNNDNKVDLEMAQSYTNAIENLLFSPNKQRRIWNNEGTKQIVLLMESSYDNTYHHLLCYVPGVLALNSQYYDKNNIQQEQQQKIMASAQRMLDGCWETYNQTTTGLGPESMQISSDMINNIIDSGYYLRPEFVESVFILYRLTGDQRYQDMAWNVFQAIERHCKRELGYVGLKDVNKLGNDDNTYLVDEMPSFFIAETLKYLLLTFAPDDYVSLDEFVFTTEAHPLRRLDLENSKCLESTLLSSSSAHQPVAPIFTFGSNLVIFLVLLKLFYFLRKRRNKLYTKKKQR